MGPVERTARIPQPARVPDRDERQEGTVDILNLRRGSSALPLATAVVTAVLITACNGEVERSASQGARAASAPAERRCAGISDAPIHLPGGTFTFGDETVYPEEGPAHTVAVNDFWIDPHEVTNRQFTEFVKSTGYVTVAEQPVDPREFPMPASEIPPDMLKPGSAVFVAPSHPSGDYRDWWEYVPGANWKKPYGPHGRDHRPDEPVVHLAYRDMTEYAAWRRGRLPTEAEWEYAAKANSNQSNDQPTEANTWQGVFPLDNRFTDGFAGIAPIGCFQPNAFGLYDMIGNVWEMTSDFYTPGHDPHETSRTPRRPAKPRSGEDGPAPSHVIKGGSYLCAPNYCHRYRAAARQGRDSGLGASNVGFRLVYERGRIARPKLGR
jgi:formylglycine-generating enzyme required for sulfatase activity